jgi:hypothetical protein
MVRCFRKGVNFFGIMSRRSRSLVRIGRKTETLQDKTGYLTERVWSHRALVANLALRIPGLLHRLFLPLGLHQTIRSG